MSRYVLRRDASFEVFVGWDDPLGTFFAQAYDVPAGDAADDDVLIFQSGTMPGEVLDATAAVRSVEEWAPCPPGAERDREMLIERLSADQANRQEPTDFQRETFKALTGKELP